MDVLLTIGKAAKKVGVPTSTARQWVRDFPEAFSEHATPEPGETRLFAPADLDVLWTVKVMRAERLDTDQIADRLAAGERRIPDGARPEEKQTPPPAEPEAEAYNRALQVLESRLAVYDDKLAELNNRLLDAEIRAARAETELRILRASLEEKRHTGEPEQAPETPDTEAPKRRPTWWDRLTGRD